MPGEVICRSRVNASCKQLNKGYNLSGIIQSSGRNLAFAVCHWVWEVWLSWCPCRPETPCFLCGSKEGTAALDGLPVKPAKNRSTGKCHVRGMCGMRGEYEHVFIQVSQSNIMGVNSCSSSPFFPLQDSWGVTVGMAYDSQYPWAGRLHGGLWRAVCLLRPAG